MAKLKVGETVTINDTKYTVLREKGDLYYASSDKDDKLHILRRNDTVISTIVPAGIFRLSEKKKLEYPKEFEIQEEKILIWGIEFTILGEPVFNGETISFRVEYEGFGCITLNARFNRMILDSAIAG